MVGASILCAAMNERSGEAAILAPLVWVVVVPLAGLGGYVGGAVYEVRKRSLFAWKGDEGA